MCLRLTVLVVDDEPSIRTNIRKALSCTEISLKEVESSDELIGKLKNELIDIIILDLEIPKVQYMSSFTVGLECLDYIKENYPSIPVIVFTDYDERSFMREAFRRGAFDCIGKTQFNSQKDLIKSVNRACSERLTRRQQSSQAPLLQGEVKINLKEREIRRIEQQIDDEYKLLTISEETLSRIRSKKLIETDVKEVIKLERQEFQEHENIGDIESRIHKLVQALEALMSSEEQQSQEQELVVSKEAIQIIPTLQYDVIPTGIYHLLRDIEGLSLISYEITNHGAKDCSIVVQSWIERYSDRDAKTVSIKPGATETICHLPVLIQESLESVTRVTNVTLHSFIELVVENSGQKISDNVSKIKLHARDTIPFLLTNIATGEIHDLTSFISAWVTPHIGCVETILRKAIEYHPEQAIIGYQGGYSSDQERAESVRSQVKAMFEALKEEGNIKYLSSTISFGQKLNEVMQRVRLPRTSLALSVANCIDGAVLFASLIEGADMNPVIALVPGHAFVGWEIWDGSNQYEYLETTLVGSSTFEQAKRSGMEQCKRYKELGRFSVVKIKEERMKGILPME